jgi:D-xylose transport system substrate-binding protein
VSWNNFQQPRWAAHDKPNIQQTVEAGGGTYTDIDANNSTDTQLSQIDTLINQGVNVLILLAADTTAIKPALDKLADAGIPVIAYDRLIEDPRALYITFDNVAVGKAEADAVLGAVPPGTTDAPANYVLIKGDPGDPNASTFLPMGWDQAGLKDAVDAGTIKILNGPESGTGDWPTDYGTYTDKWATSGTASQPGAQENMETIIDKAVSDGTTIDAILAENDSTALGVVNALVAKNYPTFPPLSGQDGDTANLNNVALGRQFVDVWKNANELGKAAGAAALQLCQNPDFASVTLPDGLLNADVSPPAGLTAADFTTPGPDGKPDSGDENVVKSFILNPQPLLAADLQQPIDAGYPPRTSCARTWMPLRQTRLLPASDPGGSLNP